MIDGWFVVRSFLTENPKFSAHIFALPLDVNVPHSVEQKAACSGEIFSPVRSNFDRHQKAPKNDRHVRAMMFCDPYITCSFAKAREAQ